MCDRNEGLKPKSKNCVIFQKNNIKVRLVNID